LISDVYELPYLYQEYHINPWYLLNRVSESAEAALHVTEVLKKKLIARCFMIGGKT
jgi:hypothetical protein